MKNAMIAVLVAGLTLVSGVSAMEMMDSDSMMAKDTMMTGSMTHGDAMMKKETMTTDSGAMMKKYNRMSTVALANAMRYTWKKDRFMLATNAGITGYTGTAKQNLMIRKYLMNMMKEKMMTDTMTK